MFVFIFPIQRTVQTVSVATHQQLYTVCIKTSLCMKYLILYLQTFVYICVYQKKAKTLFDDAFCRLASVEECISHRGKASSSPKLNKWKKWYTGDKSLILTLLMNISLFYLFVNIYTYTITSVCLYTLNGINLVTIEHTSNTVHDLRKGHGFTRIWVIHQIYIITTLVIPLLCLIAPPVF